MAKKYLTSTLLTQGRIQGEYDTGPVIDLYGTSTTDPLIRIETSQYNAKGFEWWQGGGLLVSMTASTLDVSSARVYAGKFRLGSYWATHPTWFQAADYTAMSLTATQNYQFHFFPGEYYSDSVPPDYAEPDLGVPTLYIQNGGDPSTGDNAWMRMYVDSNGTSHIEPGNGSGKILIGDAGNLIQFYRGAIYTNSVAFNYAYWAYGGFGFDATNNANILGTGANTSGWHITSPGSYHTPIAPPTDVHSALYLWPDSGTTYTRIYTSPTDLNGKIEVSGTNSDGDPARLEVLAGTLRLLNITDPTKFSDIQTTTTGGLALGSAGHGITMVTSVSFNSSATFYRGDMLKEAGGYGSSVFYLGLTDTAAGPPEFHIIPWSLTGRTTYIESATTVPTLYLQNDGDPDASANSWLRVYVKPTTDADDGQAVIEGGGFGSSSGQVLINNPILNGTYSAYATVVNIGYTGAGVQYDPFFQVTKDGSSVFKVDQTGKVLIDGDVLFSMQSWLAANSGAFHIAPHATVGNQVHLTPSTWHSYTSDYVEEVLNGTAIYCQNNGDPRTGDNDWTRIFTDSNGAGHIENSANQLIIAPENSAYAREDYSDATAPSTPRLRIWNDGDPTSGGDYADLYVDSSGILHMVSSYTSGELTFGTYFSLNKTMHLDNALQIEKKITHLSNASMSPLIQCGNSQVTQSIQDYDSSVVFWVDETSGSETLHFQVRKSDGTYFDGTVALTATTPPA